MTLSVTVLLLLAAWLLGGFVIMRPIQELVDTTHEMAEGNLDIRPSASASMGEFGVLVRSISEMAESLAKREQEQIAAENAIRAYAADLERSNRDLQDFANIASHDLQEPLRKIANFSDILVQRYSESLDKTAQDYLDRIQVSVQRLHSLILALLDFSRISTKTQPPQPVDLNQTIKAVLSDLEFQLDQVDAVINVKELPTIVSDPIQMHQLFLNLISNSLKFRKPDTITNIDIYSQELRGSATRSSMDSSGVDCYKIVVSDNGIGFDEKYLDKVFQPFQRLHPNDQYSGSGMGLSICRKILERHGGEITASSVPGEGATFTVTYPCDSMDSQRGES
jgi:light-regulated signal transduction histidine kinase (bacteriophytochrome)